MSSELERLEAQLRRSFEGGAWHGPSVLEALQDVTPDAAYAHPVADAHSIWELVLHLGGTYRLVLRRLQGNDAPLAPAEDWPPVPSPTASNWTPRTPIVALRCSAWRIGSPSDSRHTPIFMRPVPFAYARIAFTGLLSSTPVNRTSSPWNLYVSRL